MRNKIDVKQAILNPSSVFRNPAEVVACVELDRSDKIKILEQWQYDALDIQVAEEENMQGPPSDLLHQVLQALTKLQAESITTKHTAPTKQQPPTKQDPDKDRHH